MNTMSGTVNISLRYVEHIIAHHDALFLTNSPICGTKVSHKSSCAWGDSRVEFPLISVFVERAGKMCEEVKMAFKRCAAQ